MPWSYNLTHCAEYHQLYERVVAWWISVLPSGSILEVDYADLVRQPEPTLRRVAEFARVGWEPRMLRAHAARDPVYTASSLSVRQPIHARSLDAWREYEEELSAVFPAARRAGAAASATPTRAARRSPQNQSDAAAGAARKRDEL